MAKLDDDGLAREFLECLREIARERFPGKLFHAFVDWYVRAEFGEEAKWNFTDGPNDRGIDAIVWRGEGEAPGAVVIQAKFSGALGAAKLVPKAYRELEEVVEAFRAGGKRFEALRDGAGNATVYDKAFKALSGNWPTKKKAFRLITTCRRNARSEFDSIPADSFVCWPAILKLYSEYRKTWTPKAHDLTLYARQRLVYPDAARGAKSYLFNARVVDFQRYLGRGDVARLVARNVRFEIGDGRGGKIGRAIRRSYTEDPREFWYRHNGITIVCDRMRERTGHMILEAPSVINGAQTLYAIQRARSESPQARVGTRVIVRGKGAEVRAEDDVWLQSVIKGVNNQNPILASDFRSNEPEQATLQRLFQQRGVFYERKRGEWRRCRTDPRFKGLRKLTLRRMGQILMTVSERDGHGVVVAKRGFETIFSDHYDDLFRRSSRIRGQFPEIYAAFRLHELLRERGYPSPRKRLRQRHAFLNCLWLLHRGVWLGSGISCRDAARLNDAFNRVEGQRTAGAAVRRLTRTAWATWGAARNGHPELSANNFFKSEAGNRRLLRAGYPKMRSGLRALARQLGREL
ncbi:MAG: AIPR family protein [Terriglobales bacterium]